MPLTQKQEADLRAAVERGARPNRQATGRTTLPLGGNRYAVLANARGESEHGAFYKTLAGENQGRHGLGADPIVRLGNGNREFLQIRGKTRQLLRTLLNDGTWSYTRAGKAYFSQHEFAEYIVHVPVRIETFDGPTGSNGRQRGRVREDYLPWSKFGNNILQSQLGTEAERRAQVVERVKHELDAHQSGDEIMQISGEIYTLDESRHWSLTEMKTRPGEGGAAPVTTVDETRLAEPRASVRQADRRLGHRRGQASHLFAPEDVLVEAFEDHEDRLCVPRQLCKLLGCSFEHMCTDFDVFLEDPSWRSEGVS